MSDIVLITVWLLKKNSTKVMIQEHDTASSSWFTTGRMLGLRTVSVLCISISSSISRTICFRPLLQSRARSILLWPQNQEYCIWVLFDLDWKVFSAMALLGNKSTTTNLDNELYRYLGGDITAGAVDNRHICNRRIVIFSTVLEFSPGAPELKYN